MESADSLKGSLLVANGVLQDPNFRRTVVLVGEHTQEGALGVVLNRPATATVEEVVPPLAELATPGDPLFFGGPVQPDAVVILAEFDDPERADLLVLDRIGFLVGVVEPERIGGLTRARIYAGYAGWGPGQLEAELEDSSWLVEPGRPDDVFAPHDLDLWRAVVKRKGRAFAMLSLMPPDPSLN
jgi:putative transcriptional regulator